MNIQYVLDHTIFETIVGSRAYGTYRLDSDTDKAGIMIPGKEYFLGFESFEQFQGFPNEDHTVYDIRKILNLMLQNNPNTLDLLYSPDHCILKITPYWEKFREVRESFLSTRVRFTFGGYAFSQLKRIRSHRKFLFSPPIALPKRSDFGLPEQTLFPTIQLKAIMASSLDYIPENRRTAFVNELDRIYGDYIVPLFELNLIESERIVAMEWLQMGIKSQAKAFIAAHTYIKEEYNEMAKQEIAYYTAMKEYNQYQEWKRNRNPARAEMERKSGYDLKFAMHLVRLFRQGKEILENGVMNVDRKKIDADELKAILNGAWSFDQVEEYAEKMDKEFEELYKKSTLPRSPNLNKIRDLCIDVCSEFLFT